MYKVLMIDDDQYLLFQYEDTLKDIGFSVDAETDIKTFYDKAISYDYDAIICDMALSSGDFIDNIESMGGWRTGLALCKKIRSNGSYAKLIALTYSNLSEAAEWFSQDESVAFCSKINYPPLEFAIALKHILDNPDIPMGELEETDTLQHRILAARNNIPNTNSEIIARLDKISDALKSNDNKSFKSSVSDFLSLAANISGIISSTPTLIDLISSLNILF